MVTSRFSPPSESEAKSSKQHVRARYWLTKLAGAAQLQRLSLPETETLINDLAVTRGMGQFNWSRAMSCQLARARAAPEARCTSFATPLYRFLLSQVAALSRNLAVDGLRTVAQLTILSKNLLTILQNSPQSSFALCSATDPHARIPHTHAHAHASAHSDWAHGSWATMPHCRVQGSCVCPLWSTCRCTGRRMC